MNIFIYEGTKLKNLFRMDGTIPEPSFMDNAEFKIVQTIIKLQLKGVETEKWNKIFRMCMGVS